MGRNPQGPQTIALILSTDDDVVFERVRKAMGMSRAGCARFIMHHAIYQADEMAKKRIRDAIDGNLEPDAADN